MCIYYTTPNLRKAFSYPVLPIDNVRRIRNDMEIDNLTEGADIVRFIKAQRIKWLGHIQRMDQARLTRKPLDWKHMGTRVVGKPRQWRQKDVMEDLKKLKVKNWKEAAKNRRTWSGRAGRPDHENSTNVTTVEWHFVSLLMFIVFCKNAAGN